MAESSRGSPPGTSASLVEYVQGGHDGVLPHPVHPTYSVATSVLHSCKVHLTDLIRTFWGRYCYDKSDSSAAEAWIAPDNAISRLQCIDHIKDALHLHVYRLTQLLDMLPYTRLMFNSEQKSMIIMKCYIEVIVLRWVMTTNVDGQSIRGVTGIDYKWGDIWYVLIRTDCLVLLFVFRLSVFRRCNLPQLCVCQVVLFS